MQHAVIFALCLALLAYGLFSRRLDGWSISGPMLFVPIGFLVGPAVLGWSELDLDNTPMQLLVRVTLILVLFSDAASIDLRQLRRDHSLPLRTLLIGMPLTIAAGTAAAVALISGFTVWEAALLAAILTPTDAALGKDVVTNPELPVRIRQAINVESGLNDGIALPFVLVFAALAGASHNGNDAQDWLAFAMLQLTLGPLAGAALGYLGGKLVERCHSSGWMSEQAEGLIALSLAFGAFALAESFHGNGFIAAFVGGLAFGNALGRHCSYLYEFAESEGQILVLLTFLAFGGAMLPAALPEISARYVLYAVLSLTVLRVIPIAVSLLGTRVRPVTSLFLGWFGPRGLASVLFVLLILEEANIPNASALLTITVITVVLSIFAHGLSAGPAARWYASHTRELPQCEENKPVPAAFS